MRVRGAITACLLVAAAATALAAGGCGSSDEEQIREVLRAVAHPRDRSDAERACRARTARAKAQMAGTSFGGDFAECVGWNDPEGAASASIPQRPFREDIVIRGDRAEAFIGEGDRVALRKVDGAWKIDSFLDLER